MNKCRRKVTKLTMGKKHRKRRILESTNTESDCRFKDISTQVSPKKHEQLCKVDYRL